MFLSFQWVIKMKSFTLMFNTLHSMSLKSGMYLLTSTSQLNSATSDVFKSHRVATTLKSTCQPRSLWTW